MKNIREDGTASENLDIELLRSNLFNVSPRSPNSKGVVSYLPINNNY